MFRFSIEKDAPIGTGAKQLASAGITPDDDFPESLQGTGEYRSDERYFRVENERPKSPEQAVEYVQRVIHHVPRRVWIEGESYETDDLDLSGIRPPGS
ncbi:MAG: hypothetical protein ACOCTG_01760 [Bacteroidota bacterium]